MVGMANFVASDTNMNFLKKSNLKLDDLIKKFADTGIFFNVAADFNMGDDPYYKKFITQYMTEEDWDHIHGKYPSKNALCDASNSFFSVDHKGEITSCAIQKKGFLHRNIRPLNLGNFFSGKLKRKKVGICPASSCRSIISYPHRLDNSLQAFRHLEDYIKRNTEHRRKNGLL